MFQLPRFGESRQVKKNYRYFKKKSSQIIKENGKIEDGGDNSG